MMTTIRLHGRLGKLFGREWRLDVESPNEVIRAICTLKPAFKDFLLNSEKMGVVYQFCANKRDLCAEELCLKMPGKSYDLFPVPVGSKKMGVIQLIIGVVLIAASWWAGGAAGWAYLGVAGKGFATALFYLGASMVVGGIASLIMNPKSPSLDLSNGDNNRSYLFSGSSQTTRQGGPVPVGYGRLHVGACVISAGLSTSAETLGGYSSAPYGSGVDSDSGGQVYGGGDPTYIFRPDGNINFIGGVGRVGDPLVPSGHWPGEDPDPFPFPELA